MLAVAMDCLPPTFTLLLAIAGCQGWAEDSDDGPFCDRGSLCSGGLTITADRVRAMPKSVALGHDPSFIEVGDLADTGVPQIYVGTRQTVIRLDGDGWTEATEMWFQPDDGVAIQPLVTDLTGDGAEDFVIGLPGSDDGAGQVVIFPGPVTGPVSWDTPNIQVKGSEHISAGHDLAAEDLNGDGLQDLVARGDDVAWVKFGPVLDTEPFGVAGDSTWNAQGDAKTYGVSASGDLSGDGVPDLAIAVSPTDADFCGFEEYFDLGWELRVVPGPLGHGIFEIDAAEIHFTPPAEASGIYPPTVGDFDGDGTSDLLYEGVDMSLHGLWWVVNVIYAGPLASNADPTARFATDGDPVATGDFDGDGVMDLFQLNSTGVIAGPLEAQSASYNGDCTLHMSERWVSRTSDLTEDIAWVGQLDDDGLADVVVAGLKSSNGWAWVVLSGG